MIDLLMKNQAYGMSSDEYEFQNFDIHDYLTKLKVLEAVLAGKAYCLSRAAMKPILSMSCFSSFCSGERSLFFLPSVREGQVGIRSGSF